MSADFEKFLAVAVVLWIASQLIASLLGGLPMFNKKLAEVRKDTAALDAIEAGLQKANIEMQINLTRRVLLPILMAGVAITPAGDANEAINNIVKIFDALTDFKPNVTEEAIAAAIDAAQKQVVAKG